MDIRATHAFLAIACACMTTECAEASIDSRQIAISPPNIWTRVATPLSAARRHDSCFDTCRFSHSPIDMSTPRIVTSPATPTKTHAKRGSIASPISPILTSPTARKMSTSSTPQHTKPLPFSPKSVVPADPASHPQLFIAGIVSTVVLTGTMYSIFYDTSLNTSVASLLPERSAYLARKSNVLNQWFVKKSWGWTSLAFMAHWISSPPSVTSRQRRLASFVLATLVWLAFAGWFFGASLNHRVISLSGGTCALSLPKEWGVHARHLEKIATGPRKPVTWGDHVLLPVPHQFCDGTASATPKNMPELYSLLKELGVGAATNGLGRARWHAGFDISGHTFLLTLSSLILARELAPSWRITFGKRVVRPDSSVVSDVGTIGRGGSVNQVATLLGSALIGLWTFMLGVTAVYFHNPPEKVSGLGRVSFCSSITVYR